MSPFKPVAASSASTTNAAAHGVGASPTRRRALFPDEAHACFPSRRAQFVKLSKNALPPAPTHALSVYAHKQPLSLKACASQQTRHQPSPTAKKSNNNNISSTITSKPQQRIANPCDTDLWGFPVYFSPTRDMKTQWTLALAEENQPKPLNAPAVDELDAKVQADAVKLSKEDRERQDYALYIYFAAKYGPLDTLLYCCAPFPGHVYALLVDQSARKLQRWSRERVKALRNHWIARLSHELSVQWLDQGLQTVVQSFEHQQRAGAFLRRLQWHVAAKTLRNWLAYTQMQIEIKWRFNFAAGQDLRARFQRWKQHIEAAKAFKRQLNSVARRKRMAGVFVQWQQWRDQQERAQQLLVKRWLKTQRDCFMTWRVGVKARQHASRAARVIQRHWRGFQQRTKYQRQRQAGALLVRVARGWRGRQSVHDLKAVMAVGQTLLQLTRVVAWKERCATLQSTRERLYNRETEREAEEVACAITAEAQALAFMNAELDKVVRNQMHQRLQDKLKALSYSGEAADELRTDRAKLIEFATLKLREDIQREARAQAIVQFRGLRTENSPLEGCLACQAASLVICNDSEMERSAEYGSAHTCSCFPQASLATIASKLDQLRDREAAFERELEYLAIHIPVLRRELHLA